MSSTANEQALLTAASTGDVAEIRRLLNEGVDIECTDKEQWTPLHKAAHGGHADAVRLLLEKMADASTSMPNGQTLLASVIQHHQFAIADILHPISYPEPHTATVDGIVVEAELSRGSMTSVLRATYQGQSVAVKGPRIPNQRVACMLREEVHMMQMVSSPYVVPLLAVLDNRSREPVVRDLRLELYSPAMIMEYMDQGDLHAYLEAKRHGQPVALDVSTLDVALVVAHALADLHRQNIVHRDVNSLNILLSTTHYIRLGGFGSARLMDDDLMTSNAGTLFRMAPEVIRVGHGGQGRAYTTAADIYSLGVVLTELDTLDVPYADVADRWSIMEKVRTGQLRPHMSNSCPKWLADLADQCLAFDPKERPTAEDIINVLLAHRNDDNRLPIDQGNVIDELLAAVRHKNVIQMRQLLASDFDPDVQDDAGLPLLHLAVDANTPELLAAMLTSDKFSINGTDLSHSTPLDHAVRNQNVDAALALVQANAQVQSLPQDALCMFVQTIGARAFGMSLLRAASDGDASSVDRLLRAGAQRPALTSTGEMAGASLPNTDPVVTKALVSAVLRGHAAAAQCLLDLGADVSTILPNGQTLLAAAVQRGYYKVAEIVCPRMYAGCTVLVTSARLRVGTELRRTTTTLVAKGTLHDKPVVIKGPTRYLPWLQNAMRQEVAVMQTLSSPYLQPLIAVLDDGSREPHVVKSQIVVDQERRLCNPTMIMEDMDLGDLQNFLENKRNEKRLAMDVSTVDVALVLAHALADLHKHEIIHRDVKSQNIFLSTTHYIRLGDVGSARTVDESMTAGTRTSRTPSPPTFTRSASS
ncbi:serine/threonine protein kinase [Saprolegnia diclina VS20]|uniref:Serine/threonine protein kinase n=1 Tax=Saprolegnia diclina (strain VS20) TaxID=1156394 RepID=T0RS16_SAPDV|nr:serine/threonine protein kinase [Saprolegnia diclina VS20]EQC35333.1 serine/threonine protein kinase [Saprolegnia diclina VS20]|eukprot:XP_008611083.1 serine/threonine protein kinase [Saprolegnia diclina VS20]